MVRFLKYTHKKEIYEKFEEFLFKLVWRETLLKKKKKKSLSLSLSPNEWVIERNRPSKKQVTFCKHLAHFQCVKRLKSHILPQF